MVDINTWRSRIGTFSQKSKKVFLVFQTRRKESNSLILLLLLCCGKCEYEIKFIAGSLESANSSILAARRHFKEVVGKKIRILL